jgi:hypothetical protein
MKIGFGLKDGKNNPRSAGRIKNEPKTNMDN